VRAWVAVVVLLVFAWPAAADTLRSIVLVRVASHARVFEVVAELGRLMRNPRLARDTQRQLAQILGVERIEGIDRARPWGLMIGTDGLLIAPVVMLPVVDSEQFLISLEGSIGPAQHVRAEQYKIGRDSWTGFVEFRDGWAYFVQSEAAFDLLPAAAELLAAPESGHDLLVQFHPSTLPPVLRDLAVDNLRAGLRALPPQDAGNNPDLVDPRRRAAERQVRLWEVVLLETESIEIGFSLDAQRVGHVELTWTPLRDSELSASFGRLTAGTSRFATVGREAGLLRFQVTSRLETAEREALRYDLADLRKIILESETADPAARQFAERLSGAVAAAADGEVLDLAVNVGGSRSPYRVLAGVHAPAAMEVEQWLLDIAEGADSDIDGITCRIDVDHLGDARIHAVTLSANAAASLASWLGGESTFYVATMDDHLWISTGTAALERLRSALFAGVRPVEPLNMTLRGGLIVGWLGQLPGANGLGTLAAVMRLALLASDDRLVLEVEADASRLVARLDIHDGVMRALGAALGVAVAPQPAESR